MIALTQSISIPATLPLPKILLVDDDSSIRRLVRAKLGRVFRYSAEEAESAEEAIQKLESNEFDLVICDLFMVKSSGLEVFRYLQKRRELKASFILFTSAPEKVPPPERSEMIAIDKANIDELIDAIHFLGLIHAK